MMKKAIAFLVSVMLLVGCMGVIAHAAGTCNVVVVADKAQAAVGETVNFTVKLSGAGNVDMGVWNHYVTASVPAGKMEIISATPGSVYDGIWATVSGNTVSSSALGAFDAGVTSDAVLFTFSAKVISGNYNDQLTVSVGGSVSVKETVEHEDAMGNIVTSIDSVTQQVAGGSAIITIPCTDHKAAAPVIENNVEPTCGAAGSYDSVVYCSICGTEMSRETITVPATGKHTPGAAVKENEKAATCGADGSYESVVYCSVCKTELSRETVKVNATGAHTWINVEKKPATCTEDGVESGRYCDVCKIAEGQGVIKAFGHNYEEKITKAATCTEKGVKTFTCKNDASHTYTEEIDAIGHDWDDGKVTKEATCTEKGVKTYTCKNDASHTKTEDIAALGHTPGKPVEENRVEPTCTKTGSVDIVVYCSVCGEEISRDKQTIEKKPHVDNNKDDKCDVCGGPMSDDEPKNGDITPYFVMPVVLVSVCAAAAYVTIKRKNAR